MSASAPVLKMPMAMPDSPSSAAKNRNVSPAENRSSGGKQHEAGDDRPPPPEPVGQRSEQQAATAMPPIVAYWKRARGGQRQLEVS